MQSEDGPNSESEMIHLTALTIMSDLHLSCFANDDRPKIQHSDVTVSWCSLGHMALILCLSFSDLLSLHCSVLYLESWNNRITNPSSSFPYLSLHINVYHRWGLAAMVIIQAWWRTLILGQNFTKVSLSSYSSMLRIMINGAKVSAALDALENRP